jgi:hypothetical protein
VLEDAAAVRRVDRPAGRHVAVDQNVDRADPDRDPPAASADAASESTAAHEARRVRMEPQKARSQEQQFQREDAHLRPEAWAALVRKESAQAAMAGLRGVWALDRKMDVVGPVEPEHQDSKDAAAPLPGVRTELRALAARQLESPLAQSPEQQAAMQQAEWQGPTGSRVRPEDSRRRAAPAEESESKESPRRADDPGLPMVDVRDEPGARQAYR